MNKVGATDYIVYCIINGERKYRIHLEVPDVALKEAREGIRMYRTRIVHMAEKRIHAHYHVVVPYLDFDQLEFDPVNGNE